jgi:hypothetical protein
MFRFSVLVLNILLVGRLMKLPFAVYTARQGYAWQSGIACGKGRLEIFRRCVGKMPEFDFGDPGCRGLVNEQDTIVAYRFMRQSKADSAGRDAAYLAITYFSREQARFIDADALFATYPFCEPLQSPPSEFAYEGGSAVPCDFAVPTRCASGRLGTGVSLGSAGFLFSRAYPGKLRVHVVDNREAEVQYEYFLAEPEQEPQQAATVLSPVTSHVARPHAAEPVVIHSDLWKAIAIAAIAAALFEAMLIAWLFLSGARLKPLYKEQVDQTNQPPAAVEVDGGQTGAEVRMQESVLYAADTNAAFALQTPAPDPTNAGGEQPTVDGQSETVDTAPLRTKPQLDMATDAVERIPYE